ncbi:TonB-dependent receptor SusC [Kordia antarctica]|uniref:TonB-dependent receptor SusC n=1 Tax=Kordia antarctica TaxID=1218801 RepID=A0A7L4ZRE1_9FLAO|nr:TonB-dependent receptor [Kordia antarctica]QHI39268.1 TonB-dependent receptor SusC [Kordia antarctica]
MKNKQSINQESSARRLVLLILMIFSISFSGYAQTITGVKGNVTTAEDGLPIPGVSVVIKGTTTGVATDFDGNYTIKAKLGDILEFTYTGLKSQTVTVTSGTLNIAMAEDAESLDQVIVVGYGSVKKKEVTGAVARIKSEDIEQFVSSDIASRLQGQIAGVSVSSSSGEPGEAASIQIRGITSLSGTNTPLFVVNGIPQIGDPGLSANEIQTIDILKDAASTAVYGSRGAAGVVLITTKSGKDGKMSVDFDYNYGQQFLGVGTPLMNTEDQLFYEINTANYFGGFDPVTVNNPEWLGNDNTFDEYVLVDAAEVKTYNLNLSGGTEKFSYNASGSLFDQDGSLVNSNFKRYNGRISAQYNTDNWKINASIATTNENRRRASAGLIITASRYRPYFPEIDPNSDVVFDNGDGGTRTPSIALGQALKRKDDSNRDRTNINLGIRRKIVENLDFITNVGSSITNDSRDIFRPRFDLVDVDNGEITTDPTLSGISATHTRTTKFSWDAGLDFKKQFGKHSVSAQAVVTLEEDNNKTFLASIEGVSNNSITVLNGGTLNENVGSGFNYTTKRVGTLGRIQYNYDGKYIISALARYDGSSRFGREVRWGTFPSVAVAWNVSSEPFWKPLKTVVNNFKIRLSHGQVGNDSFSDYEFASTIAPFADYIFDENDGSVDFGSAIRSYANRDIKWETSISNNIGVDISLFKNKVTITADYYNTKKEDMLFPVTLPGSSGAVYDSNLILNVGNMTNKGLELAVNYRGAIGKSKFRIGATFTTNDNEITKVAGDGIIYNGNSSLISGDTDTYATTVIAEGYEAGAFFLHETNGTIKTQEELDIYRQFPSRANAELGDLKYVDANGDGNITTEDRTYHGSGLADFEYGINLRWEVGRFDFSMNWFGTSGAEILNGNKAAMYGWQRHQDLVNQWTPDNPTSNIPSFRGRGREHPNYAGTTDYWLENGDYLRLKQATLGFLLPNDACNKIGLSKLRIYLTAQNPITFTGYDGYDPEVGNNNVARRGIDQSRYPISATYSLGVKLSF